VCNSPSRSSKVVNFGTNRKRVWTSYWSSIDQYSDLGHILPRFRDIAAFLRRATPSLFYPNFSDVPLGLDYRCCGSEERRPKAPNSCNYFLTSLTYMHRIPQRYGQTDGLTYTTYDSNTALALRASRGKKWSKFKGLHFQIECLRLSASTSHEKHVDKRHRRTLC